MKIVIVLNSISMIIIALGVIKLEKRISKVESIKPQVPWIYTTNLPTGEAVIFELKNVEQ